MFLRSIYVISHKLNKFFFIFKTLVKNLSAEIQKRKKYFMFNIAI